MTSIFENLETKWSVTIGIISGFLFALFYNTFSNIIILGLYYTQTPGQAYATVLITLLTGWLTYKTFIIWVTTVHNLLPKRWDDDKESNKAN